MRYSLRTLLIVMLLGGPAIWFAWSRGGLILVVLLVVFGWIMVARAVYENQAVAKRHYYPLPVAEFLVVVAILGTLLAILIGPVYSAPRPQRTPPAPIATPASLDRPAE